MSFLINLIAGLQLKPIFSKHFNVGSTLFLDWYDVLTSHYIKSTLKQRCVRQRWNLQRLTTLTILTLYILTLNWTTLGNVEATLSFWTSIFTMLGNVKTALRIWQFGKKINRWFKNKIIFLSFKQYGLKIFIFSPL